MGIFLGILFGLLFAGAIVWLCVACYNDFDTWQKIVSGISVGITLLLFMFIPFSCHQIDSGEVAVVKVWGEAKEVKGEGFNFDSWISTKYIKYDLKAQEVKSEISAYSQDAQSMTAGLVVQFKIQSDKVLNILLNALQV